MEYKNNEDKKNIRNRIEELIKKISEYDYYYYVLNKPIISDAEYDSLYEELKKLEEENPEFKFPYSPTQRIGSDLDNKFEKFPHKIEMLSLDKIYTINECKNWIIKNINSFNENFKEGNLFFTLEYKYDGLSAVLYYENGILNRALTRGDGVYGKDITENVKTIKNIPLSLSYDIDIAIKGEIVIAYDDFERLNKEQDELFANPRNFAAGVINRIKSSEVAKVPLKFIAYDGYIFSKNYENKINFNSSIQIINFLIKNGFFIGNIFFIFGVSNKYKDIIFNYFDNDVKEKISLFDYKSLNFIDKFKSLNINELKTYNIILYSHFEEIDEVIENLSNLKKNLVYPVDGLVLKIDNLDFRNFLGSTFHHPRWAFAYKFESPKGVSKIIDVVFQVGRGGRITPVAILEPVEISGSTVSKATLHNEDYIKSLELGINDIVSISKRGEIIPAVEEVLEKNPENSKSIVFPKTCPSCNSDLIKIGPIHFCNNDDCPARNIERIKFFVSRNGMNIETLGEKIVSFLYEKGFIKDIPDLYTFNYDLLIQFDGFGEKKITGIKESIEKSKENDFITVLTSLGFKSMGRQTCELLIKNGFNSIDKFIEVARKRDEEKLLSINGVGPKLVQIIFEEFSNEKNLNLIKRLKEIGLKFEYDDVNKEEIISDKERKERFPLINTKWVVTGSFENFKPRSKLEELIKSLGGTISDSVSSKTDFLVVGNDPGSKLQKAQNLGIKILTESEFIEYINNLKKSNDNDKIINKNNDSLIDKDNFDGKDSSLF